MKNLRCSARKAFRGPLKLANTQNEPILRRQSQSEMKAWLSPSSSSSSRESRWPGGKMGLNWKPPSPSSIRRLAWDGRAFNEADFLLNFPSVREPDVVVGGRPEGSPFTSPYATNASSGPSMSDCSSISTPAGQNVAPGPPQAAKQLMGGGRTNSRMALSFCRSDKGQKPKSVGSTAGARAEGDKRSSLASDICEAAGVSAFRKAPRATSNGWQRLESPKRSIAAPGPAPLPKRAGKKSVQSKLTSFDAAKAFQSPSGEAGDDGKASKGAADSSSNPPRSSNVVVPREPTGHFSASRMKLNSAARNARNTKKTQSTAKKREKAKGESGASTEGAASSLVEKSGKLRKRGKAAMVSMQSPSHLKKKRSKKGALVSKTPPTPIGMSISSKDPGSSLLTRASFSSLGDYFLNAGASKESLEQFASICLSSPSPVAFTVVYADNHFSTGFAETNTKYCTPKGDPCTHWNCTCQKQIRAKVAKIPVAAYLFYLENEGNARCFLLPMCPVSGEPLPEGYERMKSWRRLPFE